MGTKCYTQFFWVYEIYKIIKTRKTYKNPEKHHIKTPEKPRIENTFYETQKNLYHLLWVIMGFSGFL